MSELFGNVLSNMDYFILVIFRMAGLVISSPIFGRVNVPARVKLGLALALGYMAFVYIPPVADITYNSLVSFALVVAGEILIGIIVAFATNVFFTLTYTAGQLIDMQIGFGIVNVYDPQNNTQVPMVGNIYNILLLIVFWGVDGHHKVLDIMFTSLHSLPVGNVGMSPSIGLAAAEIFAKAFTMGVMVALPIIASGLVIEICFGAIMRTVPQLNMFVVGVPIKLIVGMIMLVICIPAFVEFSNTLFEGMYQAVGTMFGALYSTA